MNLVITIGREFGSGGRELGKRLAENLGIAYYDKEIVEEISKRTKLAETYIRSVVEQKPKLFFPITVGRTLHTTGNDFMIQQMASLYAEQTNVLQEMAGTSNCVIVGRCADFILKEMHPFRIFIYADIESRVARCRANEKEEEEKLSDDALRRMIVKVDKNREKYYNYFTGANWGDRRNYDLCINTTNLDIADVADTLSELIRSRRG